MLVIFDWTFVAASVRISTNLMQRTLDPTHRRPVDTNCWTVSDSQRETRVAAAVGSRSGDACSPPLRARRGVREWQPGICWVLTVEARLKVVGLDYKLATREREGVEERGTPSARRFPGFFLIYIKKRFLLSVLSRFFVYLEVSVFQLILWIISYWWLSIDLHLSFFYWSVRVDGYGLWFPWLKLDFLF